MQPHADPASRQAHGAWYRQPIIWVGALVFAASLAGCVWIIVVGLKHADTPLETSRGSVLGVPAAHRRAAPPTNPGSRP